MRRIVMVLAMAVLVSGAEPPPAGSDASGTWPMAGHNLRNTRHQAAESIIGPGNVGTLGPKWVLTTAGDVSATPAVVGNALYVPDMFGYLYKLEASTGKRIWVRRVDSYTGVPHTLSRATPAVDGERLYFGTVHGAAYLVAARADTGALIWSTVIDEHPAAIVTQSPVVADGTVYVGLSSNEHLQAMKPGFACCTFRGSVVAVDADTGAIRWRTYMVPENHGQTGGYAGNAVWGSTAVVDAARNSLYVGTGNNYDVPPAVKECERARRASPNPGSVASCIEPGNLVDALVALDLTTGQVKWARPLQGYDVFTLACILRGAGRPNCPDPKGPDYDFAQGPMLFTVSIGGETRELLGAGQKSGVFWAVDPETGAVVWSTVVGPGGLFGGMQWGSATDGRRIYVALANFNRRPYRLAPSGKLADGGSWAALDPATGAILWQTADPQSYLPSVARGPGFMAVATGAVTVANGVVYGGSMDLAGHMYAMDAETGAILWTFSAGASVAAGPAVVDGVVYWGSGYGKSMVGDPNRKLFAFAPGAKPIPPPTPPRLRLR